MQLGRLRPSSPAVRRSRVPDSHRESPDREDVRSGASRKGGADFFSARAQAMSEPRPASAPLAAADLDGARALVEEAGWNQVAADWRIFLDLGRGFAVRAPGGQLVFTTPVVPGRLSRSRA